MNIFELTFVLSILAGLILGGVAGGSCGVFGVMLGLIAGLAISLACYFIVLSLSKGLATVGHSMDAPPKKTLLFVAWWIANFASVMLMVLAPVGTVVILLLAQAALKK